MSTRHEQDAARAAIAAFAAALMADTIKSEKYKPDPADLGAVWADVPEKYQHISWEVSRGLVWVHTVEPIRNTDGSFSSAPNSVTAQYFDVLPTVSKAYRSRALWRLLEASAKAVGRNPQSVAHVRISRPPALATRETPPTLAVGSGSTFTRLTEAQKTAIWADVGPNWVCVVYSPNLGNWLFFSEIPKREGDNWVPGPRAEYVDLILMNAGVRGESANARANTLAALVSSQPNLPWIILRAGDVRTASVEAAVSKLPAPAPAATKTPNPVFRADAPEPRELTPAKFWQRAPKAALFATRSPKGGLVCLWRYAPHRVFCGWGHALAEALVGSLPADAISEELLPKNHAKPLARPPMLRGHIEIPAWARYLAVVPAPHGNPTFESRVRRWYFTDTKPTFPTTKNGRRTYPDWGNGRGARVLGPRRGDPIWTKLREFGESTADRVLELVTDASVPRVYELKLSAPAATQPRVPETTMEQWWTKQPDWAKYAARDRDGSWYVFEKTPRAALTKWMSDKPYSDRYLHVAEGCRPPVSVPENWRLTLIQRAAPTATVAVAEAKPATSEVVDLNGWFALRQSCRDEDILSIGTDARRIHRADNDSVGFLYGFFPLRSLKVSRADLPRHFACGTTPDEALAKASAS